MTALVFPLICTGISISSSFMASVSYFGHPARNTLSLLPSSSQISSAICGANGASNTARVSRVSLSTPPSFLAIATSVFVCSMNAEITVFRLKLSRRVVIS